MEIHHYDRIGKVSLLKEIPTKVKEKTQSQLAKFQLVTRKNWGDVIQFSYETIFWHFDTGEEI